MAALALVGSTVSANEIGVATAHGTGVTAEPIPTLNINNGEFRAKGGSVLNSDYKPALDPSTVDISKHGEFVTVESLYRAYQDKIGRTTTKDGFYQLLKRHGWVKESKDSLRREIKLTQ